LDYFVSNIGITPWNEWLGMTISKQTAEEFTELEIISHCLYEMTFMGYDEAEIQDFKSDLEKRVDDFKNMSEEEKKNLKSIDDLLSELGEGDK
jgi:cell division septum initiation protein DivIVA